MLGFEGLVVIEIDIVIVFLEYFVWWVRWFLIRGYANEWLVMRVKC